MTTPASPRSFTDIRELAATLLMQNVPMRDGATRRPSGDAHGPDTLRPAPMSDGDAIELENCADEHFATTQRAGEDAARASRKGDPMSDDERLARIVALATVGAHTTANPARLALYKAVLAATRRS